MCVALIGGMGRLERHYFAEAEKTGITLSIFSVLESKIAAKIKNVDAIVIFTNKVSHKVKKQAMDVSKARGIPVFMHHSCGVCTLRQCLNCLLNSDKTNTMQA